MSSPDTPSTERGILARVARWSVGHRLLVLAGWVVLVAGITAASSGLGGAQYANNFSLEGTESQRATDLLQREFPDQAGDVDQIVFRTEGGSVTDRAVRERVEPMLDEISTLPHVSDVVSPYEPAGAEAISRDDRIAFATVTFDEDAAELPTTAIDRAQEPDLGSATAVGLAAAIVILLITFGSFVTMGLPIVTALLGLGTGVGLIAIGTRLIDMPDFSTELAVMIGLLGMFALGISFLNGMAIAAALGVALTMLAALTILPVLLSRFGERIGRRRRARATATPEPARTPTGFWPRWAALIQRHPWRAAVAGLGVMLALSAPALSLNLGSSDARNGAEEINTRQAYELLAGGVGEGLKV